MVEKLKSMVKSRSFWTALGSFVVISLNETLGIPEETANSVVAIAIAWIIGDSVRPTE